MLARQSVAYVPVAAGGTTGVSVEILYPFPPCEGYGPILHLETNGNNANEFGPGQAPVDTPVTELDGIVLERVFVH